MDAATHLSAQTHTKPAKASDLLLELMDAFPNERVTIGEFLLRLDGRAYGLLLLLLALPMCIPNIPGISTVFAVMMFVPAVQMMIGRGHAWLPKRICAWSFSREALQSALKGALPILRRIETLARPRWSALVSAPTLPLWGVMTFIMAIVLALPIPGGNWPVGITVAAMSLALLQQDGLLAIISTVLAAITLAVVFAILRYGPKILIEIGQALDAIMSRIF